MKSSKEASQFVQSMNPWKSIFVTDRMHFAFLALKIKLSWQPCSHRKHFDSAECPPSSVNVRFNLVKLLTYRSSIQDKTLDKVALAYAKAMPSATSAHSHGASIFFSLEKLIKSKLVRDWMAQTIDTLWINRLYVFGFYWFVVFFLLRFLSPLSPTLSHGAGWLKGFIFMLMDKIFMVEQFPAGSRLFLLLALQIDQNYW